MSQKKVSRSNVLVALDVGTTKVCTLIGLINNKEIEILGVGSHPSYGLKKGCVINIDKTVKSIRCSLEEAKLMAGINNLDHATIGIAGNHIYSFNSSGVVAIKSKEVTEEDVERVIDAAKAIVIPSDREILHVLPQEFRVDNTSGIKDPVGMFGVRLEVNVHVVTGQTTLIQNLIRCVDQAGIQAQKIILQPVASSKSVLSNEEKELGVVLVDIGGGTTDLAIWKEGSLIHSQIIPVGGNHFTNDLAVALKVAHTEAERIKINHGSIIPENVNKSSHITVHGVAGMKPREVEQKFITKVLNSRADELLAVIKDIIESNNLDRELNAGYVITGGGALIKDLVPYAEYVLEKPVKLGYPVSFGGMTTVMQDPKLSTVLGLLLESLDDDFLESTITEEEPRVKEKDIISKFSESLKSVFKEIF
ncbi:MAG: cell division protein FtsA [Halobacteriovoraceae bacterium]|nr:cell division protein FtsA [Halobacteriovoraceae bacterium]